MSTKIKYAYKAHNTWVYRRIYPKHLQELLGSGLKRSLKTADAKEAKRRSIEMNQTYANIVSEADAHLAAGVSASVDCENEVHTLAVVAPRYQRARLLGQRIVADLAAAYLAEVSSRLRPGSYKSVRFALGLLVSHLGHKQVGDVTLELGKEVLGYIATLSPNVRKYSQAKDASLPLLAKLSSQLEPHCYLTPQTQQRILTQMQQFLEWCVGQGELQGNPWEALKVRERPEVNPHGVLTDEQVSILLGAKDRVLHNALLFGLLTGMRSGELCGLLAEEVTQKGNLGRFLHLRPNALRLLKSKAAEREIPLHPALEQLLDTSLPREGRLFPRLSVDRVVKGYAKLRRRHPELHGTVFHSTRKWFITQCERTGVPEHFTATLVGHHSARSQNKLTYGLYSAGISDAQKREIVDGIRLPQGVTP
ncbi:MAG: integrase [Rhodobacteraceae bacterium]|nr:integrase [Paracoccaceae bacterium]